MLVNSEELAVARSLPDVSLSWKHLAAGAEALLFDDVAEELWEDRA
ncbi:hypothetical protein [uncultured Tessaracoccus sp.]|nr:hypothetical protein [uncultured Tessaracoccus sp.]